MKSSLIHTRDVRSRWQSSFVSYGICLYQPRADLGQ
jgi:hypothetical protein